MSGLVGFGSGEGGKDGREGWMVMSDDDRWWEVKVGRWMLMMGCI